ncbi:MAG: DUF1501 domain-containing protein [Crocinitomicaceae bacterium]|nr:DUF1501 domain-containing protein [Crocinitomicaceae bacterium]
MKRREFIRNTSLGAIGTFFIPEFLRGMDWMNLDEGNQFRKLIVIQLSGGNDGLNTIIPFENDLYYNLRPQISISKNEVIKLNDELGLNPNMGEFHKLFKDGLVSIVNSVGYPNPNRSHFRSMDIWHTAVDSNQYSKSGWLGRYMDSYCSNSHSMLELDSQLSLALHGKERNGLALEQSDKLYKTLRDKYFRDVIETAESAELNEDNQGYLYKTLIQTNQSAKYLAETHTVKDNNLEFPQTGLGKKLAQVSQFIRSGFSTQVYYVSHNGFDSHVNQRKSQDKLLEDYSKSVSALVQSLEKSGDLELTLILTFSEFGRRVEENGSSGTDHGKANNLFLIGKNLKHPGIYNDGPDLSNLDDGDISYKVDFRNVYWDILNEWFGKDASKIISKSFTSLGILS